MSKDGRVVVVVSGRPDPFDAVNSAGASSAGIDADHPRTLLVASPRGGNTRALSAAGGLRDSQARPTAPRDGRQREASCGPTGRKPDVTRLLDGPERSDKAEVIACAS